MVTIPLASLVAVVHASEIKLARNTPLSICPESGGRNRPRRHAGPVVPKRAKESQEFVRFIVHAVPSWQSFIPGRRNTPGRDGRWRASAQKRTRDMADGLHLA